MTTPARNLRLWPALAMLALLVVLGRAVMVSLFAESVPYWDQWDAEGAKLIKPWIEGSFNFAGLVRPHNEHRIAFTRLLSLVLLEANDRQWDNLVSAYANTAVFAVQAALTYALMAPALAARWQRLVLAGAILATAWLPFGVSNLLVGFQNQFFFMAILALATVAMAARGANRVWTPVATVALALLGLFTMASGLLAAIAAAGVLLLRAWIGRLRVPLAVAGIVGLAAVTLFGMWLLPHIAGHQDLKVSGPAAWASVFALNAGWPLGRAGALVVWAPFALTAWRVLRRRDADVHDLLALGLGAWVLLQCAAIAYSRGSEAVIVGRYVDTLAIGIVVNVWLALRLASTAKPAMQRVAMLAPLALAALVFGVLWNQAHYFFAAAHYKRAQSLMQAENVRRFVASGNADLLDQPPHEIPHPRHERLEQLLGDPALRGALPASARAPLAVSKQSGDFLSHRPGVGFARSSCLLPACADAQLRWQGEFRTERSTHVLVRHRRGGGDGGIDIAIEQPVTGAAPVRRAPGESGLVSVDAGQPFRLVVRDTSPAAWIAFDLPVEVGPLSAAALTVQARVRRLVARSWPRALPERVALPTTKVGATMEPLKMEPGQTLQGRLRAPRAGMLEGVALKIGTYEGRADGDLVVEICAGSRCERARRELRGAPDNAHLALRLPQPIAVARKDMVTFRIDIEQATHSVAVWSFPMQPGAARLKPTATLPAEVAKSRAPRLELIYAD